MGDTGKYVSLGHPSKLGYGKRTWAGNENRFSSLPVSVTPRRGTLGKATAHVSDSQFPQLQNGQTKPHPKGFIYVLKIHSAYSVPGAILCAQHLIRFIVTVTAQSLQFYKWGN